MDTAGHMKALCVGPLAGEQEIRNADDGERTLQMGKALGIGASRRNTMLMGYFQILVPPRRRYRTGVELETGGCWPAANSTVVCSAAAALRRCDGRCKWVTTI